MNTCEPCDLQRWILFATSELKYWPVHEKELPSTSRGGCCFSVSDRDLFCLSGLIFVSGSEEAIMFDYWKTLFYLQSQNLWTRKADMNDKMDASVPPAIWILLNSIA